MKGRGVTIAVMALPFAGSVAILIGVLVLPAIESLKVRSWIATPCVIGESDAQWSGSWRRGTLGFKTSYTYSVDGKSYTGTRAKLAAGWSSWRFLESSSSEAEEFAERFPAGSHATCYVDPLHPANSVLDRSFSITLAHAVPVFAVALTAWLLLRVIRPRGPISPHGPQ